MARSERETLGDCIKIYKEAVQESEFCHAVSIQNLTKKEQLDYWWTFEVFRVDFEQIGTINMLVNYGGVSATVLSKDAGLKKRRLNETQPCATCGCTCKSRKIVRDGPLPKRIASAGNITSLQQTATVFSENKPTELQAQLKPSTGVVVPRLKEFKSVSDVVNCWRKGIVPPRGTFQTSAVIPLYKLTSAEQRRSVWPVASDSWWKASGNKHAFARIKRILVAASRYLKGEKDVHALGSDSDWESAATQCQQDLGRNPLSALK